MSANKTCSLARGGTMYRFLFAFACGVLLTGLQVLADDFCSAMSKIISAAAAWRAEGVQRKRQDVCSKLPTGRRARLSGGDDRLYWLVLVLVASCIRQQDAGCG